MKLVLTVLFFKQIGSEKPEMTEDANSEVKAKRQYVEVGTVSSCSAMRQCYEVQ